MIITPTNTGAAIAGVGLGVFSWSAFLKADKIPFIKKLLTTSRKDKTLGWMNKNKGLSLLGLEAVNFGIHGILNSDAVIFALGNTIWNTLMIFVYLPFRQIGVAKNALKGR